MNRQASGLRAWLLQRVTALYLLLFVPYLIATFIISPPANFEAWRLWVVSPLNSIGILLFFLALLLHVWVGVRDVLMDYVHHSALRVGVLSFMAIGLTACGLWALKVVVLAHVV